MAIFIQIMDSFGQISFETARLKRLVKNVFRRFKVSKAVIEIEIVDNSEIKKLSRRFLGHSHITDCISFNLTNETRKAPLHLEIVVNGQMAVRQAKLRNHSQPAELALYVVHGLLHHLGFNDLNNKQAEKMHRTEDKILAQSGYGMVYHKNKRKRTALYKKC